MLKLEGMRITFTLPQMVALHAAGRRGVKNAPPETQRRVNVALNSTPPEHLRGTATGARVDLSIGVIMLLRRELVGRSDPDDVDTLALLDESLALLPPGDLAAWHRENETTMEESTS